MSERMERLNLSVPSWWRDQVQKKCDTYGLSISALVRFTVAEMWRLQPPEEDEDKEESED